MTLVSFVSGYKVFRPAQASRSPGQKKMLDVQNIADTLIKNIPVYFNLCLSNFLMLQCNFTEICQQLSSGDRYATMLTRCLIFLFKVTCFHRNRCPKYHIRDPVKCQG